MQRPGSSSHGSRTMVGALLTSLIVVSLAGYGLAELVFERQARDEIVDLFEREQLASWLNRA